MEAKVTFEESATCDRCGRFGAFQFEDDKLCTDCYAMRCSCCPEFGADDLATEALACDRDTKPQPGPHAGAAPNSEAD